MLQTIWASPYTPHPPPLVRFLYGNNTFQKGASLFTSKRFTSCSSRANTHYMHGFQKSSKCSRIAVLRLVGVENSKNGKLRRFLSFARSGLAGRLLLGYTFLSNEDRQRIDLGWQNLIFCQMDQKIADLMYSG